MRKALYLFLVPLLILEWAVVLAANIAEITANSVKDITLALQSYINAEKPDKPKQPS
jgi:hypothetical protein